MRDTSIAAHNDIKRSGLLGIQEQEIFNYMKKHHTTKTRQQISCETGISINAVCGRVNSLVKYGMLEEIAKGKCPITGRTVWLVELAL